MLPEQKPYIGLVAMQYMARRHVSELRRWRSVLLGKSVICSKSDDQLNAQLACNSGEVNGEN